MDIENEDLVTSWIKENGNPAIEQLTKVNLETAKKTAALLIEKGLDVVDLAVIVDMHVAEVNKWLDGKHNFSEKTLTQILTTL
ncbi:helix-turn-helix domain-containing protein [Pedobacter endophyticus]|uniref:Helix-turn-helix transcriptional regulator n=1 Tax=Pedobacter endophyticus TaxID=2789740 RepID=A0A7U3Q544_9SPHI|nr:helix-turn-helix transcriptional regulator [Pedobacter endophyticus]QPH37850.1 helix-turn-helix transcriptional regulator [Pedobacter endophyticus]